MGSLDQSNQTSDDLESEQATTSDAKEAIVNPTLVQDESIQLVSDKRLISFTSCSSSVSSGFSLDEDPLQDLDIELDKASLHSESSSNSPSTPPHDDHLFETPPIQVMQRQETPKYRIPSHVFSRKQSTTPGDWGMASNESLFSIHMGSNSFCNPDGLFLQDLDYGPEASTPRPHINSSNDITTEEGKSKKVDNNSDEKEDGSSNAEEQTCRISSESSSSSSKSFVFPTLAGETEKGGSPERIPKEPKLGPSPEPESKPEATAETQKATPSVTWTKWFPCFRYCACCS